MLNQSRRPPIRQSPLHLLRGLHRVKGFWIERTPPAHEFVVAFVCRVGHRLKILLVAPHSAHVFRRTGSFALYARWMPLPSLGPDAALEQNLVLPTIPEVVLILKPE